MSEKFTNRRGRTTDVEIDGDVREVAPAQYEVKMPQKVVRPRRQIPWKWGIVAAVIVLVAVFVMWEVTTAVYRNSIAGAKNQVAAIAAEDAAALQKKTEIKAVDLENLVKKYDSVGKSLCPGAMLDNLAKLYPRALAALEDCNAYRSKVEAMSKALGELQAEAAYLERLPSILAPATKPLTDQFAVLGSQQENWQNITESLKNLSAPEQFRPAHDAMVKAAGGIMSGWTLAVSATNARNADDFAKAKTDLEEAYGSFRAQADTLQSVLNASQSRVLQAVDALNKS